MVGKMNEDEDEETAKLRIGIERETGQYVKASLLFCALYHLIRIIIKKKCLITSVYRPLFVLIFELNEIFFSATQLKNDSNSAGITLNNSSTPALPPTYWCKVCC